MMSQDLSRETSRDALFLLNAGRYAVEARLGAGAGGEVFAGRDLLLERPVAIKRLPPDAVVSAHGVPDQAQASTGLTPVDEAAARLLVEARAIARLSHPNIVAVFDVFYEGGRLHIVLERVPGHTLRQRLDSDGPFPLEDLHLLGIQLAAALAHAHAQGVVHRDLKPENVLLAPGGPDGRGVARLVDFGIARVAGADRLTSADVAVGTPAYVSPEQAKGEQIDGRADLYSLACLLYEAATGRPPFVADDPLYVVSQHLYGAPAPPSRHRPALPSAWDALLLQLLAKDPQDRLPDAAAVLRALRAAAPAPAADPRPSAPAAAPASPSGPTSPAAPAAPSTPDHPPARTVPLILAADDDRDLSEVTNFVLHRADYETDAVYDGAIAWDHFLEKAPDLVILDYHMPGLDGLEVLRRIRALDGPRAATPVIMLTARTDEATIVECLEAGANDYVSKPFSPRQLVARVRAALRQAPR